MVGKFPWSAASCSFSWSKPAYYPIGSNYADDQLTQTSKESDISPLVKQKRLRIWVIVCLMLTIVIPAVVLGSKLPLDTRTGRKEPFVPSFETHSVTFDLQELFAAPPSKDSNAAWDNLIPDGHGYVLVPEAAERYGLAPGIQTDEGIDRYSVTVYHQLHCLGMIRILFYQMVAIANHTTPRHFYHGTDKDNHDPTPFPDHVNHCFDYIRQSLMCSGDMTLEHSREPPLGEKRTDTDGWGVEHQCKDWDALVLEIGAGSSSLRLIPAYTVRHHPAWGVQLVRLWKGTRMLRTVLLCRSIFKDVCIGDGQIYWTQCYHRQVLSTDSDNVKAENSRLTSTSHYICRLNAGAILLIYLLLRSKISGPPFPSPFPSVDYEIRSFSEEYSRDGSVPEVWDTKADYPPGEGYTFIENAGAYALPPGVVVNGKANLYGTAWTHQYHCLVCEGADIPWIT
ncbi:uncharacterized protein JN550_013413 [Neoarthrinium moseri]|uniref:uncharacterized protein n=1 Tax=Neoarthrinium moseri TaxID=1658444 RepID=UPI001FDC1F1F|nr:uncharacterized protein JN550_013413 [Neoarthrinium moseri]KAI1857176.1 hypothetical protein JN550_013413 [Neoarthrinium moseri]